MVTPEMSAAGCGPLHARHDGAKRHPHAFVVRDVELDAADVGLVRDVRRIDLDRDRKTQRHARAEPLRPRSRPGNGCATGMRKHASSAFDSLGVSTVRSSSSAASISALRFLQVGAAGLLLQRLRRLHEHALIAVDRRRRARTSPPPVPAFGIRARPPGGRRRGLRSPALRPSMRRAAAWWSPFCSATTARAASGRRRHGLRRE